MTILFGIILAVYILLFILSMPQKLSEVIFPDSLPYHRAFLPFYKIARLLCNIRGEGVQPQAAGERLKLLQPYAALRKLSEGYRIGKLALLLLFIFLGDVTAVCLSLGSLQDTRVAEGRYIDRNTYGEGSSEILLSARGGRERRAEDYGTYRLEIGERKYNEKEAEERMEQAAARLPGQILGENTDLDHIREKLPLPVQAEGTPFAIIWESSNYERVDADGSVYRKGVKAEGEAILLTAVLTYGKQRLEKVIPVKLMPEELSEEEMRRSEIEQLLKDSEQASENEERVTLPDRELGLSLYWKEAKTDDAPLAFFLLAAAGVGACLLTDRELRRKTDERTKELFRDYPELISKLTLYMGAGMTVRSCFLKLAADYRPAGGMGRRYAYEEISLMCREMESGIGDGEALRLFGMRCKAYPYTRLTTLLIQNLKKGNGRLFELMRKESTDALEERKRRARKAGEEAGTKLLMPMMLMLCIVMALIILPAFSSFTA